MSAPQHLLPVLGPATPTVVGTYVTKDRVADTLVREWAGPVLRWSRLLCDARVQPEDVCQDVLLLLSQRPPPFTEPKRIKAWLWGVTWRTVRSQQRKAWIRRWLPSNTDERDTLDRFAAPAAATETDLAVKQVLDSLSADHRRLLWLAYAEGASRTELAEHLGVAVGTLNRRLTAARKAFAHEAGRIGLEDSNA